MATTIAPQIKPNGGKKKVKMFSGVTDNAAIIYTLGKENLFIMTIRNALCVDILYKPF